MAHDYRRNDTTTFAVTTYFLVSKRNKYTRGDRFVAEILILGLIYYMCTYILLPQNAVTYVGFRGIAFYDETTSPVFYLS